MIDNAKQQTSSFSILDRPNTSVRLFLGFSVPAAAAQKLQDIVHNQFSSYVEKPVPLDRHHVTLFFFGEVKNHAQYLGRLKQPLPQAFVPTMSITHIGRGAAREQLWAYLTPTPGLLALRDALDERLRKIHFPRPVPPKKFIPHIHLADFLPVVRGMGIADVAAPMAYAVREAHLYSSVRTPEGPHYAIEASIAL